MTNITTVQTAIAELMRLGYRECTDEANKQNGMGYEVLYAFQGPENEGVHYCFSDVDVFDLLEVESFFVAKPDVDTGHYWCPECGEERQDPELSGYCACGSVLEYL